MLNALPKIPLPTQTVLALLLLLIAGCSGLENNNPRFVSIDAEHSSVHFSNTVTQSPDFNILNYLYFYDGGGVSIGDVNNDGLPDIYFTSNKDSNKLYLNKGNFTFRDITEQAGVAGCGDWTTGTTMADVNADGLLDIYVSNVDHLSKEGTNQLFINNGDSTFTEKAEEYGLDFSGYSKQAVFFDMDNDSDLDMYLLNHAVHTENSFVRSSKRSVTDPKAGDRLYRNDNGTFLDVTEAAGIHSSVLGYGLAVTVSDVNGDNYQDIYVSNDFHENDYLYINQKNGTFKERLEQSIQHTSRASMGSDIADINNDLKADIAVLDMLPADEKGRKTSVSYEPREVYSIQRDYGYHPQLIRNTLQLNLGNNPYGTPAFAEIAPFAGVHATDWSWSLLLFDMDNSGTKDLFVSNGIYRRPNDKDYLRLAGGKRIQRSMDEGINEQNLSLADSMPQVKIPNKAFQNSADLTFTDKTEEWGLNAPSYSSGSAYGDLDNDGDLDLVVNNVNMPASIYKNHTREQDSTSYLTISLQGKGNNTHGLGAKAIATVEGKSQLAELTTTRGFQSSVEPRLFFGLADVEKIDELTIIWPDGSRTVQKNVLANQHISIDQSSSEPQSTKADTEAGFFRRVTSSPLPTSRSHQEDGFSGFKSQPLMPYELSHEGPPVAVADVNGDGLEDFYLGGAKWQQGDLFIQKEDGSFKEQRVQGFEQDRVFEDTDAVFFDANNDGALDLYIVSGGNEHTINSSRLFDRFYINDGNGKFVRMTNAFPTFGANGSVAVPLDFNSDGSLDLFVGSRSLPGNYGITPESYLFENQGDGTFTPVTEAVAPELKRLGMISDAISTDIDGDGLYDLALAGDWMPVTVFLNDGETLKKSDQLNSGTGLWQSLHAADIDDDGDMDLLAGNMGLNTTLSASDKNPLVMYTGDFNGDGKADPIIGKTQDGRVYPVVGRDMLLEQMPYLQSKFPDYQLFAGKELSEIFDPRQLKGASKKRVDELASAYFENEGGSFSMKLLPSKAQFAPIYSFLTDDFNGDGTTDILAGGNTFNVQPVYGGPYDASYGWFIKGEKDGSFSVLNPNESGFFVDGEIRDFVRISLQGNALILTSVNNDEPVFFEY